MQKHDNDVIIVWEVWDERTKNKRLLWFWTQTGV